MTIANVFDPADIVDKLLSNYGVGDIVDADALSDLLGARLPLDTDTYAIAKELTFHRLSRVELVVGELLRRNILADLKNYALHLIAQEHRVDYSMRDMRKVILKGLKNATREVINFQTDDPDQMAERNDALAYLDTLRMALNPRSRRLKLAVVKPALIRRQSRMSAFTGEPAIFRAWSPSGDDGVTRRLAAPRVAYALSTGAWPRGQVRREGDETNLQVRQP